MLTLLADHPSPQMPSKQRASTGRPSSKKEVLGAKHFAGSENGSVVNDDYTINEGSEGSVGGLEDHAFFGSEAGSKGGRGVTRFELSDDQISSSTVRDMSRSSPTSIGTFDARVGEFDVFAQNP